MARLVLGSRGSALALAQVCLVQDALLRAHPDLAIEVKVITTSGDRRQDVRAGEGSAAGLKGLFTKEIQDALLDRSIDAAVHSLKDLPGITPPALGLAAVLPRADPSDILLSPVHANLDALPPGARIGTGSIRRSRQLRWLRPGIEIVELRGNVPTRLQKLTSLSLDAIVLARAGLDRLGYSISAGRLRCDAGSFHAAPLDILPAIGQGAIGVETRRDDTSTRGLLSAIDHIPTHTCIRVERELLRLLDGDCRLPVAALATLDDSATLHARALVFPDDETSPPAQAQATGPAFTPESVALTLFHQLSASHP
jgi:hydroxymethylbilane synthase